MTKIQHYHFGYVLEKVNSIYEIISEVRTPRWTTNIWGHPLITHDYHRIAWCKFTPGDALSQAYKTRKECEDYQKEYHVQTNSTLY